MSDIIFEGARLRINPSIIDYIGNLRLGDRQPPFYILDALEKFNNEIITVTSICPTVVLHGVSSNSMMSFGELHRNGVHSNYPPEAIPLFITADSQSIKKLITILNNIIRNIDLD